MKTFGFTVGVYILLLLSPAMTGCSENNHKVSPQAIPDSLAETLAEGTLTLEGIDENALNPAESVLTFSIKSTTFDMKANDVYVSVNAEPVDIAKIAVRANLITAAVLLDEGRNDIIFKAYDTAGRPVFLRKTVWAGTNRLVVAVVTTDGALAPDGTAVTLRLGDNLAIVATARTLAGTVEFFNVPSRTVIVEARTNENATGVAGASGDSGAMTVSLVRFNVADATENNDFSRGLKGYEYGSGQIMLLPHVERVGPQAGAPALAYLKSFQRSDRASFDKTESVFALSARIAGPANNDNIDAVLSTAGYGSQTMTRTFALKKGTTSVSVRYRFITSEVPGGYFGSAYNDYYNVAIRTKSGQSIIESNAMNALGLGAFDKGGSTAWKRFVLKTDKESDEVQFDLTVANVADDNLGSLLVVDLIEEKRDQVTPKLTWDPGAGGLKLTWTVGSTALEKATNINVHWSSSAEYGGRIGGPITTVLVPAGTPAGATGEQNVPGAQLYLNPEIAGYLIAAVDEATVGPVADVAIMYGPNADVSAVSAEMHDAIKDGMRSAGAKTGSISRTAVTPADQARAMFQNLSRSPGPLAVNISNQLAIYATPGDSVIRVFEMRTSGLTPGQAQAQATSIQAAMTAEINAQGPASVSKHCADPSKISVSDVPQSSFTANGKARYKAVAASRSRLLDENNVYHMEIVRTP